MNVKRKARLKIYFYGEFMRADPLDEEILGYFSACVYLF